MSMHDERYQEIESDWSDAQEELRRAEVEERFVLMGLAAPPRLTLVDEEPPVLVVQRKAVTFTEQLAAHQITNDDAYIACDGLFSQAVALLDEISSTFDPIIKKAHEAHKEALAQKAKYAKPVEEALSGLKQRFLAEKVKRDAEVERLRIELEAKLQRESEERLLDEAVALESAGRQEEAELVFDEPMPMISVPAEAVRARVQPKLKSTSTSGTWKATKIDLRKLAKAVADGTVPESYITTTASLNSRVTADKSACNIPGVTVEFVPNVRVRR